MNAITFRVVGLPAPGGSKKAFVPRYKDGSFVRRANGSVMVNITDDGKRNKEWRQCVSAQAARLFKTPLSGALRVDFKFFFTRPMAHFRGQDRLRGLHPKAPKFHTKKPDKGKLERGTCDAMTKIAYFDDAQICDGITSKGYADWNGCEITVTPLEPQTITARGGLFAEETT